MCKFGVIPNLHPFSVTWSMSVCVCVLVCVRECESLYLLVAASLKLWQESGRRGAWLRIPVEKSHLIPVAVEVLRLLTSTK